MHTVSLSPTLLSCLRRGACCLLVALACVVAHAQSMSDEQVVRYVQQEINKGSDQQTIVQALLKKGVTPDQLRRIKKKYDAEQSQLGALDLTGATGGNQGTSRLRTAKERAQDEQQKQNGFMILMK